jgi:predicted enzyme related to lactoylglutathione lyase
MDSMFQFLASLAEYHVNNNAKPSAPEANGGTIVVPKMPIPGVGWLAYARDTEGSIFGIHQADPTAK